MCPINYALLCRQTVTLYHRENDAIQRTVYRQAFFDAKKTEKVDKIGSRETNSFLLVLPGEQVRIYPEDKILLGEGPELSDMEAWRNFVPAKVPGLVVVRYVEPKYWNGRQVHVEVGG